MESVTHRQEQVKQKYEKEVVLHFAGLSITNMRMAMDALNSYAEKLGRLSVDECPILGNSYGDPYAHENISLLLCGGGRINWECPFCSETFAI